VTPLSLFIAAYLLAIGDIKAYRNYIILNCAGILFGFLSVHLGNVTNEIHPVVILVFVDTVVNFLIIKKIISNEIISSIRYYQLKIIYSYALKGYIAGLSSMILGRIENLIIPLLSSVYVLGIYSISKTFYNIIISIPTAFSGYIFGVYCDNERNININICLKIMAVILLLSLTSIIFIFYFIDYFLILAFGDDFSSAKVPAKILVISAVVFGVSMPINSLLFAMGKPSVPSMIGAVTIISTIIMMFFLIPKYSLIGAAYSSLFGSTVIASLRCYFLIKISFNKYI
jgi:PST family polysaccharide transporter